MTSVLIAGHGGSGTNWLLDLLDQSPVTFCANERNRVPNSVLSELRDPEIDFNQYAGLEGSWDQLARETKHRFGVRDPVSGEKHYLRNGLRGALLHLIRTRTRLRSLFSVFDGRLAGMEWRIPPGFLREDSLDEAILVLKMIRCPALACWLLSSVPQEVSVVHILRHPGGALNSWKSKLLENRLEPVVRANNRNRLACILELDPDLTPSTRDKIRAFLASEDDDIPRSELLYWLYSNEKIYACGSAQPNYLCVNYDALAAAPVPTASRIYAFAGLPFDELVERKILRKSAASAEIAARWRTVMPAEQQAMVAGVLEGSLFEKMWN